MSRVHECVKKHKCDTCGKDYSNNYNLKHHISRVHEGAKPHKCGYCEKTFSSTSDLNKHIKRVHENLKYTVDMDPLNIKIEETEKC